MQSTGYYQQPTIHKDRVVFICDDNLWSISLKGGNARRLTNTRVECSSPKFSPDGKQIAFVSLEEGHLEVFIIPSEGGAPKRLTYLGSGQCYVHGWTADGKRILISADGRAPFFRHVELYELSPDGQQLTPLNLGHATAYARDNKGRALLGRNSQDPALWKRYRGGRAGEIWIDGEGKGQFKSLTKLAGNMVIPMWVKGRVYFLSDHEGIGCIYSCRIDGRDLKRHTHSNEYFARFPSTDGERIVYAAGGQIHVLDCETDEDRVINIQVSSHEAQAARKFAPAISYLEHYALHPRGNAVGLISRGQAFSMPLFDGPCLHHGGNSAVRYRHLEWLADGDTFVAVDDASNYERVAKHSIAQVDKKPEYLTSEDIGRVIDFATSPNGKLVALSNQRYELMLIDIDKKKTFKIDSSPADRIRHLAWSPDSRWLAYTYYSHSNMSVIKVLDCQTYKTYEVTRPVRLDHSPCFDPEGKYLYFLSNRDFKPIYDSQQFDLSFPQSTRVYVIPLRKDTPSPFAPDAKPFLKKDGGSANTNSAANSAAARAKLAEQAKSTKKSTSAQTKKDAKSTTGITIDFDGIQDRILCFPFSEGSYTDLVALKGRILFISFPLKPISRDFSFNSEEFDAGSLIAFDFSEQKCTVLQTGLYSMRLGADNQTLMYRTKRSLRVIDGMQASGKGPDNKAETYGRSSGFIDIDRCKVLVDPIKEWTQMYREAWRLQRENFWDEKMSSVDWDLVYKRYASILPRIRTRSELSDLIWEMQGELGTSHAYEFGGDKPRPRPYYMGFLGADLDYDAKTDAYKITRILRGDSWDKEADSPLAEPGLNIEPGEIIVAVNSRRVSKDLSVHELLLNCGGTHIQLTLKRGAKTRTVNVKTLTSERFLRYRHWVERNRAIVSEATKDKVGYVHIPDMGPNGFAEFHRGYLSEFHHDGLIIDARYNRGGHVSSLLLEKLLRKRLGYDVPRWGQPQPYPMESPAGPIVAITNQFAGSDGDIFSHCFKLYELGPLVGKRTWGGVIGIHPRHRLVDGSLTTQPEFSFWFQDVGWSVENYGTDPDYEVDYRPQDYHADRDPQLERAIALVQAALKKNPVKIPNFKSRPSLPLPPLLKK